MTFEMHLCKCATKRIVGAGSGNTDFLCQNVIECVLHLTNGLAVEEDGLFSAVQTGQ